MARQKYPYFPSSAKVPKCKCFPCRYIMAIEVFRID